MTARGFTLLETLIALAITALVLAALSGTALRAAAARARAREAAAGSAALRTLLLRLGAELEAAHPAPAPAESLSIAPPAPSHPWSSIRLVTVAPGASGPGPASDGHAVSYRVEPDPERVGRSVLVRREAVSLGTTETAGAPVLGGVSAFGLRAFDGRTWQASWPPGPLPRAVEVTIGVAEPSGRREQLTMTVTLPAGGR